MPPKPFELSWDAAAVDAVLERVRRYRFPPAPAGSGWTYGCDPDVLRELCQHWTAGYDWRAAVRELNRFPQFTAEVDGFPLHFLHVVGEAGGRRPLIVTHGWPGSHYEFWQVIEPLAFPSRHGGRAEDAFDLVIPSLPGFGFSGRPDRPLDQRETARLFDRLMTEVLGYNSYLAQGGDWGANVTARLALQYPERVRAILLTMLFPQPPGEPEMPGWAEKMTEIDFRLGGYRHTQATKPQSLAWAMADNPVGQLAWIVERFHDWADLREQPFERVFTRDQLLTTVMLYVMTDAFTTSVWYYAAAAASGTRTLRPGERVTVPTAFAKFPDPLRVWPPRQFVETGYAVSRWSDMPRGGHFAAMEVPDLFVAELRDWARSLV